MGETRCSAPPRHLPAGPSRVVRAFRIYSMSIQPNSLPDTFRKPPRPSGTAMATRSASVGAQDHVAGNGLCDLIAFRSGPHRSPGWDTAGLEVPCQASPGRGTTVMFTPSRPRTSRPARCPCRRGGCRRCSALASPDCLRLHRLGQYGLVILLPDLLRDVADLPSARKSAKGFSSGTK